MLSSGDDAPRQPVTHRDVSLTPPTEPPSRDTRVTNEQAEFWSNVASKYDRVVDLQIGGKTRSMVRERVAREGELGRLVEFGCGTGFYTELLARRADSLVATDISPGMLDVAKQRVNAPNVTFQAEDCQRTSLPDGAFDTAFISLVLHFTVPDRTVAEMHRILRPGGTLIMVNLDTQALNGVARVRSLARIIYQGAVGYRIKPPKGFGRNVVTEAQLRQLLDGSGFRVGSAETIRDSSRSSNIPVQYVRAAKT
jgi:ABC-2 type transport system ATP-binding protein